MSPRTPLFKPGPTFIIGTLLYWISAAVLFPFLIYYVDNPDTLSYLSIAGKYSHGNFSEAVNGYWSPAITWLLALLRPLPVNPVFAFKVLQVFIGYFAFCSWMILNNRIIQSRLFQWLLTLVSIPFLLSYGLLNLTPDLLFLAMLLAYLNLVSVHDYFYQRRFGISTGIIGSLLYFTKAFGWFFFLVHLTILSIKKYRDSSDRPLRQNILKNYSIALLGFVFITGWWIFMLSSKYGRLTISENVAFNLSEEVAGTSSEMINLPILTDGLTPLPNATAINAWEDPGLSAQVTPIQPSSEFRSYFNIVKRNLLTIWYFDIKRQLGIVFLILLVIFLFTKKRNRLVKDHLVFSVFLSMVLVYGGYSLILVHTRYIWLCTFIMLLFCGFFVEQLLKDGLWKRRAGFLVVLLAALLAVKRPVKEILFSEDKEQSFETLSSSILYPFKRMNQTYAVDRALHESAINLKSNLPEGSRIASIKTGSTYRDSYTQASLIAFYTQTKFLGQLRDDILPERLHSELEKMNVQAVLTFANTQSALDSLSGWKKASSFQNENAEFTISLYRKN